MFDIIQSIWFWGAVVAAFVFAITYAQVRMMSHVDGIGRKFSDNQWALLCSFAIVCWPIFIPFLIQVLLDKE